MIFKCFCVFISHDLICSTFVSANLSTHVKEKKKEPLSLFAHGNHIATGKEIEMHLVSGVF